MDMNTNKIKLCAFADEADPMLDGQIEALKANDISLLEIRGVDGKSIVDVTVEEAKEIKAKLARADKELADASAKAAALVESAKLSSDFVLAELDKVRKKRDAANLGSELERTRREIRQHLRENESKFNPVDEKKDEDYVLPRPLRKGDNVYIVNIGKNGVVVDEPDKSGNVNVRAGIISMKTKVANLKLVEDETTVTGKDKVAQKASDYTVKVSRDFKSEIDLRGMTGDEAWLAVDKYLDEAMVAGIRSVRLVHGKGTGALKNALWKFLRGDRRLASFRIGQYGEGDGGVTVVELK